MFLKRIRLKPINSVSGKSNIFAGNFFIVLKNKIFILLFTLVCLTPTLAQKNQVNLLVKPVRDSAEYSRCNLEKYLLSLPNGYLVEGSIYLNDAFAPGTLIRTDNSVQSRLYFRYNILRDEFYVIDKQDTGILNSPRSVKYLSTDMQTFVYTDYIKRNTHSEGYFQLLADGKFRLLLKYEMTYDRANPTCSYLQFANEYDQLRAVKTYYIQEGNNPAEKIRTNLRSISRSLKTGKDSIKTIVHRKNLNINRQEDIVKLINFLNQS